MKIGEKVRIIAVPESVVDVPGFATRSILCQCIGKVFRVAGFQGELLAIDVGALNGKAPYLETIWIEPSCVEAADDRADVAHADGTFPSE